ncbi:hypothetical protein [Saccharomonospora sp.]|uniref:hypothetical protein n=1 Tax=Saccharomonospora sp. TaxID=33913 RepID=UPI00261E77FC|nr:hypothetical protein [Saccharomonospora sp.]
MGSNNTRARKYTVEYLTGIGALVGFVAGMLFDQVLVGMVIGMALGSLIGYVLKRRSGQN